MNSWKRILVNTKMPIKEVMLLLNLGKYRIAFICENQNKLLGVITDGDIRRHLLNGGSIDEPVEYAMNFNPIVCSHIMPKIKRHSLMKQKDILSMPIVNDNGIVVGIELRGSDKYEHHIDRPVLIMAGGFGTRLGALTADLPKPMLKIGDKPILQHIIERLKAQGFGIIFLSVHYKKEKIIEFFGSGEQMGVKLHYLHEEHPLGTGGAIGLIPKEFDNYPLLIVNGDIISNIDFDSLVSYHQENNFFATMCLRRLQHKVAYGVVETKDNRVVSQKEKPIISYKINAGIYVISKKFKHVLVSGERVDMPTLIERGVKKGKPVGAFTLEDYWIDVGVPEDFNKARSEVEPL